MKVNRARVISEAGPEGEDVVEGRGSERADVREARNEAFEVGTGRRHLGLLEHDLGDPDPIRRALSLPGKVAAAVALRPGEQRWGKPGRGLGRRHP